MLCQMWLLLSFFLLFECTLSFFCSSLAWFRYGFGFAVSLPSSLYWLETQWVMHTMHTLYVYWVYMYLYCYVSINEFYLILMESKVIEAQQPKYLVTFTLGRVIFLMPLFFCYTDASNLKQWKRVVNVFEIVHAWHL